MQNWQYARNVMNLDARAILMGPTLQWNCWVSATKCHWAKTEMRGQQVPAELYPPTEERRIFTGCCRFLVVTTFLKIFLSQKLTFVILHFSLVFYLFSLLSSFKVKKCELSFWLQMFHLVCVLMWLWVYSNHTSAPCSWFRIHSWTGTMPYNLN